MHPTRHQRESIAKLLQDAISLFSRPAIQLSRLDNVYSLEQNLIFIKHFMAKQLFLSTIFIVVSLTCLAQGAVGGWKIHSIFGSNPQKIIDTGSIVYYLANRHMFSYDKENEETESYSKINKLNDIFIDNIFYNHEKNYLVIAYENSDIDVIMADGSTVNIPDIYNASIQRKTINDITFAGDRMYVATEFGYVVINDDKFEVVFSRIFNVNVMSVTATDDYLWLNTDDSNKGSQLYYCQIDNPSISLENMEKSSLHERADLLPAEGNSIYFTGGWLYYLEITNEGSLRIRNPINYSTRTMQRTNDGYLQVTNDGSLLHYFDMQGKVTKSISIPDEMRDNSYFASWNGTDIWELSTNGIRNVKFDEAGSMTVLSDYFKPNASSVDEPQNVLYNEGNGLMYVMSNGPSQMFSNYRVNSNINTISDGWWKDITPESAPTSNPATNAGVLQDISSPVFHPDDADSYFVGSWYEGAYQIKGSEVFAKYDWTNSPIVINTDKDHRDVAAINALQFDAAHNLWMIQGTGIAENIKAMVLPYSKISNPNVTVNDWIIPRISLPSSLDFRTVFLISPRNDIKIIGDGTYNGSLIFIDDHGNPSSASINTKSYFPGDLYDQDGLSYEWNHIYCLTEDVNGQIWMGTNNGVIEFSPGNAFNQNFTINRIKVPRNDGTNYADYLLDGVSVTAIAVDGANRKWIGTSGNGIYLVSDDGTEILQHFTTDNSSLTSDQIYKICCDPNSNSVYIGTPAGVVEYYSDASPGQADLSGIYAYPNPVRPEYTGDIAITGLMDNTLVKIADVRGNVIKSIQSIGGTAVWDGCNSSGERVKTGVYFVLASQSDDNTKNGVVTKILFIN